MGIVVYLVRHGEVEHHRNDVSLTPRGRAQAEAAGVAIADRIADGHRVSIQHSPLTRNLETAELLRASLSSALAAAGRGQVLIAPSKPDMALCNPRFFWESDKEPEEPSLLFAQFGASEYLRSVPPARAEFYRGFWTSRDPMGYWLTHGSAGGAETPAMVLDRLLGRLRELFADGTTGPAHVHWIGVTHSGTIRALLRHAFGSDPGEPDFCAAITLEPFSHVGQVMLSYHGKGKSLTL